MSPRQFLIHKFPEANFEINKATSGKSSVELRAIKKISGVDLGFVKGQPLWRLKVANTAKWNDIEKKTI